jgi:hypothetical protein
VSVPRRLARRDFVRWVLGIGGVALAFPVSRLGEAEARVERPRPLTSSFNAGKTSPMELRSAICAASARMSYSAAAARPPACPTQVWINPRVVARGSEKTRDDHLGLLSVAGVALAERGSQQFLLC